MKMTCDTVRDILPIYKDGICSEDSKEIVNEHLKSCEKCKEELRLMNTPIETYSVNTDDKKIIKASKIAWRKRKYRSFAIGCVAVFAVVVLVFGSFIASHWFSSANENDIACFIEFCSWLSIMK